MRRDPLATLCTENIQPRPRRGGWHGGPTPVGALRGVTHDMAAWKPAADRKSIWELALHIAYWKYAVRRRLERGISGSAITGADGRFPVSPANWPRVPSPSGREAWSEHVSILRVEHERLVATVAAIPSSRYTTVLPGGRRWTAGELILGIAQHDAYHTGQIQLLKRLWDSLAGQRRAGARRP